MLMRRISRFAFLIALLALTVAAQTQIPELNPTQQAIDLFSFPQRFINQMLTDQSQLLINVGLSYTLGLTGLVMFRVAAMQLATQRIAPVEYLVVAFRYGIVMTLLTFYTVPTPLLGGSSVVSFLSDFAQDVAGLINLAGTNALLDRTNAVIGGLHWGTIFDVQRLLACFGAWTASVCMQATILLFNAGPQIVVGCCALLGPIFIPFYITEKFDWLFWGWFRAMLIGSLSTLTATTACFVFTNAANAFMDELFSGKYDIAHLTVGTVYFVLFSIFGFVGVGVVAVGLPLWITSGSGHHGHGSFLNSIAGGVARWMRL